METGNRFSQCLLEQKNEDSRQAKRLRRRTVLIAILIQAALLSLLMLRPLFGASADRLMIAGLVPLPPWKGAPATREPVRHHPTIIHPHLYDVSAHPYTLLFPDRPAEHLEPSDAPEIGPFADAPAMPGFGGPNGLLPNPGLLGGERPMPPPPPREVEAPPRKPIVVPPDIQQAMLVTRVEPLYPVLARQIRLQGTVVIRAIIAKDGTVESAEILSGHPLLARAAMDAIVRWRYRPTLLRGQPIEVETMITVKFIMH
jgi:periplasmic protein TonB